MYVTPMKVVLTKTMRPLLQAIGDLELLRTLSDVHLHSIPYAFVELVNVVITSRGTLNQVSIS